MTVSQLINRGISESTEFDDIKRIRFTNIACLIAFTFLPPLYIFSLIIGNYQEGYPLLFFTSMFTIGFILNANNRNQLASFVLLAGGIICSYWVTAINQYQVAAPYFNLLFGMIATFAFKNKFLTFSTVLTAFLSFFLLNAYQLEFRAFSYSDYLPVLILLFTTFLCTYYYNKEFVRNEHQLKKQSEELLELQKEQHENKLSLLKKDIDTIVANNRMQLQVKENILKQLIEINEENGSLNAIRSIQMDLKSQIQTQQKLHFSEQNIQEINAQFFDRLIENHPNLSKRERELCSYIRLQLSTKEIASLTNATVNTIYVTKNRLRSKLNLKSNVQVDSYIINL